MANSTLRAAVNRVLLMKRLIAVDDDDVFNDDSQLGSDVVALKVFFDLANRLLITRMNERFLEREFQLNLVLGTNTYDLDAGISSESLTYHSFINTTTGSARPILGWQGGYASFKEAYPDETTISSAAPQLWVLYPITAGAAGPTHKVRFYPNPDANYNIVYRAKLNMVPLLLAADVLLFPPEYEHVLWMYGKALLEAEMGAGGEDVTFELASKAVEAVKEWASGPLETRPSQRLAVRMQSTRRRRKYDFNNTAGWY